MVMFIFSVFDRKSLFWLNLVKKIKNLVNEKAEIWYLHWFEPTEFNSQVHFFCYQREIPFLGKFGSKNQDFQFEPKFGT